MQYIICEWNGEPEPHIASAGEVYDCPYRAFSGDQPVPLEVCKNCHRHCRVVQDPNDVLTVETK